MSIGIDPLIDFACKKLLGSPEHPAITLHFLNAILGGRPRITNVEILNPIIEKEFEDDKYAILDIDSRTSSRLPAYQPAALGNIDARIRGTDHFIVG